MSDLHRDMINGTRQLSLGQPVSPAPLNGHGHGSSYDNTSAYPANGSDRQMPTYDNDSYPSLGAGAGAGGRKPSMRDSTLESAGEAADIFELYGSDPTSNSRNSTRESWTSSNSKLQYQSQSQSESQHHASSYSTKRPSNLSLSGPGSVGRAIQGQGQGQGERESSIGVAYGSPGYEVRDHEREELVSPKESEASWSGPMGVMGHANGTDNANTVYLNDDHSDDNPRPRGDADGNGDHGDGVRRWSDRSDAPDISITDTTPSTPPHAQLRSQPHSGARGSSNGNGNENTTSNGAGHGSNVHIPSPKRASYDPRKGSLASSIASSTGSHPNLNQNSNINMARLSPRHPSVLSRTSAGGATSSVNGSRSTSTTTSYADAEASMSQISVAGSSQYPGEEDDAFYIRSTYARLDSEGVHGDGWDPGVERTRGGPAMGKRATVYPANKAGDIGEQERQFLASLDRYGFVNEPHRNRSETRIALIPSAPLTKIPKLPAVSPLAGQPAAQPASSFIPSGDAGPSARAPPSPKAGGISNEELQAKKKETARVDKWAKMMTVNKRDQGGNIQSWEWSKGKDGQGDKLLRRVYKGIPDRWRMAAWWTMAEDKAKASNGSGRGSGSGKGKKPAQDIGQDFKNAIDLPSTFDVQIDLDVPRTISGHTMFVTRYGAGQRNLWHVLHCFSQVCETCGYVQGMGPIAATLLCYFDPERAYTLLVRLHDVYGMHDIFEPGFPGLLEAFYVQERLMEWLMPDVYQSFQRNMISSSSWGTKWYITLFVNTVPFSQQLRLWDALWMDGRDVMVVTSVAILWAFKDLLSSPKATFESILSLLSSYFVAEDDEALMRWIRKTIHSPGMKAKMDAWRAEWHVLVREGKSGTALL